MRILVTGGAGFIGSNFVRYLARNHPRYKVRVIDALTYAGNIENLYGLPEVEFLKGDITNREDVAKAMKDVHWVVHFAAETHVDRSRFDPEGFYKTNVMGTKILLEEAYQEGVSRFHHVSTDEVFGALHLNSEDRFSENTPYNPSSKNPYSNSKVKAELEVKDFHRKTGLDVTISNCSNNFGPYHYPEKFIPLSITNLIDGLKIPLYGDGLYVRDWLHVDDHASAIDTILHKGKSGETYLIGANCEMPNIDIAKMILRFMGKDEHEFRHVEDRPGHDRRYAVDSSKLQRELGWQPIHARDKFPQALLQTIEWYKKREDWWRPLLTKEGPVYDKEGNFKGTIGINRELGGVKFRPVVSGQERI